MRWPNIIGYREQILYSFTGNKSFLYCISQSHNQEGKAIQTTKKESGENEKSRHK